MGQINKDPLAVPCFDRAAMSLVSSSWSWTANRWQRANRTLSPVRSAYLVEASASRAVERSLAAVARENIRIRALIHLDPANARARAALLDNPAASRPLCGLTFVAKDLIDVAGLPTTSGSRLFDPICASEDAHCVHVLQAAGAVVVGKSNMHELAVGGARNPWFGQVVNPLS